MAITLRDAQHLCWKNFRKINDKLNPNQGKTWTPAIAAKDLFEETKKLTSIIKVLERSKTSGDQKTKRALAKELSNILYTVFVLAEQYNIKLEEVFLQTVNDYILSLL